MESRMFNNHPSVCRLRHARFHVFIFSFQRSLPVPNLFRELVPIFGIACPCLPLPAPNSIRGTRFGELDSGNLIRGTCFGGISHLPDSHRGIPVCDARFHVSKTQKGLNYQPFCLSLFRHGAKYVVPNRCAHTEGHVRILVVVNGMVYPEYLQEILRGLEGMYDIMHS